MDERYIRNLGALSEEECAILRTKKVFVAGCGGLGGHIIDGLLRIGVGEIKAADGDIFEPSNLNRQLLSSMGSLGKSKAAAAREHAESINPDVAFTAVESFINGENAGELIRGCDAVMDALDNIPSRKLLAAECSKAGIPYVYGAIRGWAAQAAICRSAVELLASLYPQDVALADKSSLAFTPALCASMQTALCVRHLCGRDVDYGKLYFFDLSEFEFTVI